MKEVWIRAEGATVIVTLVVDGLGKYITQFSLFRWQRLAYQITASWVMTQEKKLKSLTIRTEQDDIKWKELK